MQRVVNPPGAIIIPEVVERIGLLDAQREASRGSLNSVCFGGVDHVCRRRPIHSTITPDGVDL